LKERSGFWDHDRGNFLPVGSAGTKGEAANNGTSKVAATKGKTLPKVASTTSSFGG